MTMARQSAERVRREIIRLCHAGLDSRALRIEVIRWLRKVIPIDVSFFTTADPATLLFTGAVVDEVLERATPQFLENEFLRDDVNKFSALTRSATPFGSLTQATQRAWEQSPRYREILAPLALGDELRLALMTGGVCWGFLCLHRERSSPHFTASEAAFLGRLAPHIALGLRKALLLRSVTEQASDEPGLLLLADDLSVAAMTPSAERWLAEIAEEDWPRQRALPYAVSAVVAQLKAIERGVGAEATPPKARLRGASGHWLTLHALRLSGQGAPGQIAVIIEMARPVEIAPLITLAYGLSRREKEIMQSVLRGLSTAEMVDMYRIAPDTAQQHLKAIFDKVGVRSRRELVGRLFGQQYQPRIASGRDLGADGWFI